MSQWVWVVDSFLDIVRKKSFAAAQKQASRQLFHDQVDLRFESSLAAHEYLVKRATERHQELVDATARELKRLNNCQKKLRQLGGTGK